MTALADLFYLCFVMQCVFFGLLLRSEEMLKKCAMVATTSISTPAVVPVCPVCPTTTADDYEQPEAFLSCCVPPMDSNLATLLQSAVPALLQGASTELLQLVATAEEEEPETPLVEVTV